MPSSAGYVRNYSQERKTALRRGELKKNASRKAARRAYEKAKGRCNGDVDHKDGNPMNNSPSNLRCVSKRSNRSFPRNAKGGKKISIRKSAQNSRAYR